MTKEMPFIYQTSAQPHSRARYSYASRYLWTMLSGVSAHDTRDIVLAGAICINFYREAKLLGESLPGRHVLYDLARHVTNDCIYRQR